ncbi:hypothetical protein Taro_007558 [Colocasia esculenta]|uniref:Uncharacterized protein n=1 Tax=Colocasia esculenta TaxID=4460 RepID=A0A843TZC1_COLES|nr:hypothetical protein [Colocasia esculenta]
MSLNQSRVEKSEAQARKPGRPGGSGHQSGDSGGGGKRAGGGSAPPPPSSFSSSSYSVNHPPPASRRKFGNVEGGYSRVNSNSASPELRAATVSTRDVLDGGHAQASSHGSPDVLGPGAANPTDSSASRNYRGLPRPPPSQSSAEASLSATPETPAKGGTSKAFALQFGSISPGLIPARTSSAPPNLDEQKHEQALHNTFQVIPAPLVPSVPKEQCQQSVKDVVASNHHNEEDSQPSYQAKRVAHVQVPSVPSMAMQKPSVPAPGVSLPIGFQQPQIPIQFTGTSPLMQPNGITGSPLQIPLSLSMGNAQVQQHIFVPSVPSHILPQGIHQGIGFAQQIGNQLASHMGIGLPLPYAQQQAGMLASVRKTPVRITHPDTHEELKFDRIRDSCLDAASLGKQPPSNVPSQTQPIPSYTPSRQTNHHQPLHPASYNPGAFFVPTPPSLPFASIPVTSGLQAARHGYQIGQSGTAVSFMKPQMLNHMPVDNASSQLHDISEPVSLGHSHDLHSVPVCAPSAPLDVTGKPAVFSTVDKAALPVVTVGLLDKEEVPNLLKPPQEGTTTPQQRGDGASISESCAQQPKSVLELPGVVSLSDKDSPSSSISLLHSTQGMQPNMPPRSPASVVDCASFISSADSGGKDSLEGTDLLEDQQTMPTNKGILQSQQRHQL